MTGTSGTGRNKTHYYYKCPGKDRQPVPRDQIEHAVAEHVRAFLGAPESLDALVDKLYEHQEKERRTDSKAAALEANLKDLDRKIEQAVDVLIELGPDPDVKARLDAYRADRAIMRADLEKLQTGPVLSRDVIRQGLQLVDATCLPGAIASGFLLQ